MKVTDVPIVDPHIVNAFGNFNRFHFLINYLHRMFEFTMYFSRILINRLPCDVISAWNKNAP